MNISKRKINIGLALLLAVSIAIPSLKTDAQNCSDYEDVNQGNLLGYITASNLPSSNNGNLIYVSSVDDPWPTGEEYAVSFDRTTKRFSGMGWNETLGWIDFDYGTSDEADAVSPDGSDFGWGGYDGRIRGLNSLDYSNNEGRFAVAGDENGDGIINGSENGQGVYDAQYVSGQAQGDAAVGMGLLSFNNVTLDNSSTLIPSECQETVDVYANNNAVINLPSCNNDVEITWTTNNIESGSCSTVSNGAPWNSPVSVADSSQGSAGITSGNLTSGNTPAFFEIRCTGDITGNSVKGSAKVTCGENIDPNGEGSGTDSKFRFIES